jgi:hypothetical protein
MPALAFWQYLASGYLNPPTRSRRPASRRRFVLPVRPCWIYGDGRRSCSSALLVFGVSAELAAGAKERIGELPWIGGVRLVG